MTMVRATNGRSAKRPAQRATRDLGKSGRAGLVQSLGRGLALLDSLSESPDGISLSDLSQQVGLSVSTTHRLLTTLEQQGFVRCHPGTRHWSIGVQAFIVGSAFVKARDLLEIARPRMRSLMEQSGETVNLAVLDGGEAVFLAQVECRQMMRALAPPGVRVPLHCSGLGKALLAALPEAEVQRILRQHGLPRLTPRTLTTIARLRADLARTRERGYALDDQEHSIGLCCVAAVVFNEHGEQVGSVSLSGPAVRIPDERVALLGDLVRKTAEAITSAYSGNR
jgi:IclR family transcriptional regulator, acetate operon repressor